MTRTTDLRFYFSCCRIVVAICIACSSFATGFAQQKKIIIACIGNSITAGARTDNPAAEAYPAVLASLLAADGYHQYEVRNFGIGGATMLRFGTPNLWLLNDSLQKWVPDIVIIKAGTNETVGPPRNNWAHIDAFETDYTDYINAIRKINPVCLVIICSPLDMVLQTAGLSPERLDDLRMRRPRIWQLRKRVKQLAKNNQALFLDLTKPFKGKAALMTKQDGVHPNAEGYRYLATLVYRFMVKHDVLQKG